MTDNTFDEAARTAREASRRVAEGAAEAFRNAGQASMHSAQQGAAVNREVFNAWRASTEATMKATFELKNAAINAGLSLIEATGSGSRAMLDQWVDTVQQAQQRTIEAWQSSMRAADDMAGSTGSNDTPQQ